MNAIVTGATKGMGRSIVKHLAANKYNVALCARNEDELRKFLEELSSEFPKQLFFGMKADLENLEEVKGFADFAGQALGEIDVLVNNAGLYIPSGLRDEGEGDLQRQMAVNLYAPHYLSLHFASKMSVKGSGYIINICSIASLRPVLSAASYTISKTALLSLTRLIREEYSSSGIKVTAILPGATLTDSWAGTDLPPERFVLADDIARAVISCLQMSSGANLDEIIIRPLKGDI